MSQFQMKRSSTTDIPTSVLFGEPVLTTASGQAKLWLGDENNGPFVLNSYDNMVGKYKQPIVVNSSIDALDLESESRVIVHTNTNTNCSYYLTPSILSNKGQELYIKNTTSNAVSLHVSSGTSDLFFDSNSNTTSLASNTIIHLICGGNGYWYII